MANEEGWKEVLIVAGTPVREKLEDGETWEGVYLGHVKRQSTFGPVKLHLMQLETGEVQGMWGSHAIDEGFGRARAGHRTRVTGRGVVALDSGKEMHLVRMSQHNVFDVTAPVIENEEAIRDEVMKALGMSEGELVEVDPETGEVTMTHLPSVS